MMRLSCFMASTVLVQAMLTAAGSRIHLAHLLPDVALIVVVFMSLRQELWQTLLVALFFGYTTGQQALAPLGLHEAALVLIGVGSYISGNLAASGRLFFGWRCGVASLTYHLLLFLLLWSQQSGVGFASWPLAMLLPSALLNGSVGWLLHPLCSKLQQRLTQTRQEGLTWH